MLSLVVSTGLKNALLITFVLALVVWPRLDTCAAADPAVGPSKSEPGLNQFMPRAADFTFLWWANGPPNYFGLKGPPPEPVLCFQSGVIGLALETKQLRILHAGRFSKPLERQSDLERANAAVSSLPPLKLEL